MEENPLLSQKIGKSETTQQMKNPRGAPARGGASNNSKRHNPDPPASGQVAFRLLCHVHTAGGVIGSSGSIIKHLETVTGSSIRFEEGLPNCHERVINIVGDAAVERKISAGDEEDNMVGVSKAQEGLVRVLERVFEVEMKARNNENEDNNRHHGDGFVGCRLLAPTAQIGAVMGKGGKIVDKIRKSSGARIRVLNKEQIPACAGVEEELVQIVGRVVAVKKALLAVSHCLQDRTLGGGTAGLTSSQEVSHSLQAEYSPNTSPNTSPCLGTDIEHHSVGHALSEDVGRILNLDDDSSLRKVVFRFLCSNAVAGGVIGKGANIVKFLEKETGASIKFASPVSGSKERVAIISSFENPDPLYSPAQIAIIRVFARCIEVGLDHELISSLANGASVAARILVASSQIGCLLDEDGRVASDISTASAVEIQLNRADLLPNSAANDYMLQITGDYENVKSALFQVTGRLRENFFSEMGPKKGDYSRNLYPATPSSSPYGKEVDSSTRLTQLSELSLIFHPDHLGSVQKLSSSCTQKKQWEQGKSRGSIPRRVADAQRRLKHKRDPKQTVDVIVPREVFGSVYGENGDNLARLKEISGAHVTLQDPSPGECTGKVILSGTSERIQIAQSLLQAFISF